MKDKNYSLCPYWDTRAMDEKTKLSRIMLTVNMRGRSQFRITLRLKSTKLEFIKATSASRNLSTEAKEIRKALNDYFMKAETILERLSGTNAIPTKETFTRMFKSETDLFINNKTSIVPFFQFKISKLFGDECYSTSSGYRLTLISLHKFKSEIHFEDIDVKFLKGYLQWMLGKGNSITTAQIYIRNLRTVYNEVLRDGIISASHTPFKGLQFGSKVKSKAVLYPAQLKQLLNYETTGKRETRAKAYFFFSYLSNGMNFSDIALLKYKNIQGDMFTFIRKKTKNACTNGAKEIKVYLHDMLREIIATWGNKMVSADDYIFPVINKKMTPYHKQCSIARAKRTANKKLTAMGIKLGFDVHLCLALARHSYATKQKIDGIPTSFISDALGHTTTNTTEHYLKSLPDENLKVMSSNLLTF